MSMLNDLILVMAFPQMTVIIFIHIPIYRSSLSLTSEGHIDVLNLMVSNLRKVYGWIERNRVNIG